MELEVGTKFRLHKGIDKLLYNKLLSCGFKLGVDYVVILKDRLIGITIEGAFSRIAIDRVTAKKIYVTVT